MTRAYDEPPQMRRHAAGGCAGRPFIQLFPQSHGQRLRGRQLLTYEKQLALRGGLFDGRLGVQLAHDVQRFFRAAQLRFKDDDPPAKHFRLEPRAGATWAAVLPQLAETIRHLVVLGLEHDFSVAGEAFAVGGQLGGPAVVLFRTWTR
mgnify:CR=1 FL=1